MNTIFGGVNITFFIRYLDFLLDTMGAKSKCYLFVVIMFCALIITVGSIFNVLTIAETTSCIPKSMHDKIDEIVEEIGEKIPICEMPALVWIILFNLLIILSAKFPKMTFDRCKTTFGGRKDWDDVAFLSSVTVSF